MQSATESKARFRARAVLFLLVGGQRGVHLHHRCRSYARRLLNSPNRLGPAVFKLRQERSQTAISFPDMLRFQHFENTLIFSLNLKNKK